MLSRKLSFAVLVAIAFCVVFLLVRGGQSGSERMAASDLIATEPQDAERVSAPVFDEAMQHRVVRHLVGGNPAKIVDGQSNRIVLTCVPLAGSLSPENKQLIAERYRQGELSLVLELSRLQSISGQADATALLQELGLKKDIARAVCVQAALAQNDYVILPRDAAVPRDFASTEIISNHYVTHDGASADVVFFLEHRAYPMLADASKAVLEAAEYVKHDRAYAFNSLPYEERKRLYEDSSAAQNEIDAGPPAAVAEQGSFARSQWKTELAMRVLPDHALIDRATLLVVQRPSRSVSGR
ncbi:MAG: hypothetical protein MUC36_10390 [Planctomycetes bacterium]|nr:hypothetical protein [Planctomycetota bacterium]